MPEGTIVSKTDAKDKTTVTSDINMSVENTPYKMVVSYTTNPINPERKVSLEVNLWRLVLPTRKVKKGVMLKREAFPEGMEIKALVGIDTLESKMRKKVCICQKHIACSVVTCSEPVCGCDDV